MAEFFMVTITRTKNRPCLATMKESQLEIQLNEKSGQPAARLSKHRKLLSNDRYD